MQTTKARSMLIVLSNLFPPQRCYTELVGVM